MAANAAVTELFCGSYDAVLKNSKLSFLTPHFLSSFGSYLFRAAHHRIPAADKQDRNEP